ncbi:MAG: hypothetical protein EBX44_14885 [Betaproteobacteria bacterium]|nr:hypothetical protein [Betaproteobacteria bacterium]
MRALLNRVVNRFLTPITADTAEKREPNMNELLLEGARLSGQIEAGLLKACLTQCYINPGETRHDWRQATQRRGESAYGCGG